MPEQPLTELPPWVLRMLFQPGGARLPKLTTVSKLIVTTGSPHVLYRCAGCNEMKPWTSWKEGRYLCSACLGKEEERTELPGNLSEEEYRFWVGSKFPKSFLAICRACRKTTYNKLQREQHKLDNNPPCTRQLVDAYKECLKKGKCLTCGGSTTKARWGVPLCSLDCEETWKFDQTARWLRLEVALKQQKTSGLITGESTSK